MIFSSNHPQGKRLLSSVNNSVPEYYRDVSELLLNTLDIVGYSREDRDRKGRVATECEVFCNIAAALGKLNSSYTFGSRGEGSTVPGLQSNIDNLYEYHSPAVVTDLTDCHPDKYNYLMVKDNFTYPGYVKLQLIDISPDCTPVPIYHIETIDKLVTLDTLNRSVYSNTLHHRHDNVSGSAMHCPVNTKEFSTDSVCALRCSQWPREGYEWFQRRKFFGWATPQQTENAWEYGCFATPVGHHHSSEQHLEWMLSFSIAERDLTRSIEDTAMKVYILLKMIKKTYIEPVVGMHFQAAIKKFVCFG